jgi:hypothetical protein
MFVQVSISALVGSAFAPQRSSREILLLVAAAQAASEDRTVRGSVLGRWETAFIATDTGFVRRARTVMEFVSANPATTVLPVSSHAVTGFVAATNGTLIAAPHVALVVDWRTTLPGGGERE